MIDYLGYVLDTQATLLCFKKSGQLHQKRSVTCDLQFEKLSYFQTLLSPKDMLFGKYWAKSIPVLDGRLLMKTCV